MGKKNIPYIEETYDVVVVGAWHAGCEAALACARLGLETMMFTVSVDSIALMPCNPNIGGSSKGHLVREIDALGGEMGKNIDKTFIQSKMLNKSKGPAVHSLRAQADKAEYTKEMRKTTVHITTNGSFLSYYLKKFIINRRFISGIYPTIDSMALNYMTRYDLDPSRNNTNETFKLLCCIKTLLHYGIHVDLGTNIDRHNHKEIWNTLDDLKKLQLLQDKNFAWTIGRVDDRLYETNFPDIMMESEILAELQSKPLPDNVHAAFLKTCYNFADKMGLKLNLREHKQTHSYCWSTSSSSNVFYVDMNLKTYRCTCTVGRSRYSLFDFSYENLTNYRPVAVTCNSYAECKDCKIGGFCGGGCQLSHQIDFKKCCTYEEEVFSHFMKTLFIPYIKSKYNEVNQNERKAENRCT